MQARAQGQARASSPARAQAQPPSLRGRALRLLGRREFSRAELESRLRPHTESPEELHALLDELAERGGLSDTRFAEALVRQRKDRYGKRAIAQRLKQAGVSAEDTAAALTGMDADTEFHTACALLQRKFRHPPADDKEKARQVRFLQARGYTIGTTLRVLKASVTAPDC